MSIDNLVSLEQYVTLNPQTQITVNRTNIYYHKQPHHLHPNCLDIMVDHKFFPGSCPNHPSCPYSTAKLIDSSFFGMQQYLCMAFKSPPPTSNLDHHWYRSYTLTIHNIAPNDTCSSYIKDIVLLKYKDTYEMYTAYQIRDWARFSENDIEISPSAYLVSDGTIYYRTSEHPNYEPIVSGKILSQLVRKAPIECVSHRGKSVKKRVPPCSYLKKWQTSNMLALTECGAVTPSMDNEIYSILPKTHSFSLPGSNYLKNAIHWTLNTLLEFIDVVISYVYQLFIDFISTINEKYKLLEYTILVIIITYYVDNPIRILAIVLPIAVFLGVERSS